MKIKSNKDLKKFVEYNNVEMIITKNFAQNKQNLMILYNENYSKFIQILANLKNIGISQKELAERIGVEETRLSNLRNLSHNVTENFMEKLSDDFINYLCESIS